MKLFAIDLGNKRVKMKSERGEYVYPASYLSTNGLSNLTEDGNQTYQIADDKFEFVWGNQLEIFNKPEKMIDTYVRTKRYNQKKVQRLLEFALARLAADFPESEEKSLKIQLVLGLSITDLHQESQVIAQLQELMVKKHHVLVNGKNVLVEIASNEDLHIIPQFMGTIFDQAYDANLTENSVVSSGQIGVMDIGGGTILASTVNHLEPSNAGEERFEGIQSLIKTIAAKTNISKLFLIEQILQQGNSENGYFYQPNQNEKDEQNITEIVQNELENYTRFTIAPLITEVFPDVEALDYIFMTGGGSLLVSKEALLDEIGEDYYDHLTFVTNQENVNVSGYYKAGQKYFGIQNEKTNEKKAQVRHLMENIEQLNQRMEKSITEA